MVQPLLDVVSAGLAPGGGDVWLPFGEIRDRVPPALEPWLAEPGLLTARVRAACGAATRLRLLRLVPAPVDPRVARRLGSDDHACLLREIEFTCGPRRWIFAQSVFPQSTVQQHPWLRELGDNGLGESLNVVEDVRREPLEYLELRGRRRPGATRVGATGRVSSRRMADNGAGGVPAGIGSLRLTEQRGGPP